MPVIWMPPAVAETQDVVAMDADDRVLPDVLDRQRVLADLELSIAEMLYRARTIFIGGMCLPWRLLTPGKQREYVREAKALIQGVE